MQNKHDPAKQLKKAGTAGQESTVFILLEENEQSEPIRTLPLNQEVVKRKNQRARGHSTLLTYIVQAKQDYNQEKGSEKLCQKKKRRFLKQLRPQYLRCLSLIKGLQQGVFPWGYAVHTSDNRWSYFINAKRFAEVEGIAL